MSWSKPKTNVEVLITALAVGALGQLHHFDTDRTHHAPAARGLPRRSLLAQEKWKVVRLPVITDDDERHSVETVFGRQTFCGSGRGVALRARAARDARADPPHLG
jgi:hypothetical protein